MTGSPEMSTGGGQFCPWLPRPGPGACLWPLGRIGPYTASGGLWASPSPALAVGPGLLGKPFLGRQRGLGVPAVAGEREGLPTMERVTANGLPWFGLVWRNHNFGILATAMRATGTSGFSHLWRVDHRLASPSLPAFCLVNRALAVW